MEMSAVVCESLKRLGHEVFEAPSLAAARALLSANSLDLVLCDLHLRGSDSGVVLLRELAHRSPDLAVVMMTGNTTIQIAIDCLRDGAFDYLLKPFSIEQLKTVTVRVLQRRGQMLAERERVESQLRILGKFPSENPNPVLRVARQGQILYSNEAGQVLLTHLACQVGQDAPAFLRQLITDAFGAGRPCDIEVEAQGRTFSFAVTPIRDADYVYLYGHDITPLKETQRELIRLKDQAQELALHDALTGLPNRMLMEDRLQLAIAQSERSGKKLALVFIDLDNFKTINDSYGHRVGDQVLVAVAGRFRETVRRTDTVARWGGDELIVLLPEVNHAEEARLVCERLKSAVQQQIADDHLSFPLTISMGIALYPDDATLAGALLQKADMALYLAKSRGRDAIVLFSESSELNSLRDKGNLRLLLTQAVSEGRIQVHYQPIVESATGRIVGVEALARWYEESLGWVSPSTFVALAEEMGLIYPLGLQMLKHALQQQAAWKGKGFSLSLSVNVSIRQVCKPDFCHDLSALAGQFSLQPGELTLELTESQALLGLGSETQRLDELSQRGFRLSIDDFGQGYSSLSSLHAMPVSELKLDIKFTRNLQTGKGRRIARAIVEMARTLGLRVVAEGVEEKQHAAIFKEMGIDRLQGYLFGRPMPAAELERLLG